MFMPPAGKMKFDPRPSEPVVPDASQGALTRSKTVEQIRPSGDEDLVCTNCINDDLASEARKQREALHHE